MQWQQQIMTPLHEQLAADSFWTGYFGETTEDPGSYSLHLGIFIEPYLSFILKGRKSVESRFSLVRQPPWGRVQSGDVLVMKRSGGPVLGIGLIANAWSYELDEEAWPELRDRFREPLAMDEKTLWNRFERAAFATLMLLEEVRALQPFAVSKKDRRGWVVLRPGLEMTRA